MSTRHEPRRAVPSVGSLLEDEEVRATGADLGEPGLKKAIRDGVDRVRAEIDGGVELDPEAIRRRILETVRLYAGVLGGGSIRRVINATGVVLHTNLGRAPLGAAATRSLVEGAAGYNVVEMNLEDGRRGRRFEGLEAALCEATGSDAALVVNNNAAAVLLAVSSLVERRREVLVSRGELVEIGGSFRVPDVVAAGGAVLREVGTTNRTHLEDYEAAIGPDTAAILVVNPSNFHVSGFTARPDFGDLLTLAHGHGVPVVEDQGSGYLADPADVGLPARRTVGMAIAKGADLVTFSGDKILGGPQAGIVVGSEARVNAMRKHPLARAIRADRLTATALEATIRTYLDGRWRDLPVMQMLTATPVELSRRAQSLADELASLDLPIDVGTGPGHSAVGGGAFPEVELPTTLVLLALAGGDAQDWARRLRLRPVPVVTRVRDGQLCVDPRTLLPGDTEEVVSAIAQTAEKA